MRSFLIALLIAILPATATAQLSGPLLLDQNGNILAQRPYWQITGTNGATCISTTVSGKPTNQCTISAGAGTVTNVSATAPIVSSGGNTPNISCPTCVTTSSLTLQGAYNGSAGAVPSILLASANKGVTIRDAATPIAQTLFGVQDNTGATKFVDIQPTAMNWTGASGGTVTFDFSSNVTDSAGNVGFRVDTPGGLANADVFQATTAGLRLLGINSGSGSSPTITFYSDLVAVGTIIGDTPAAGSGATGANIAVQGGFGADGVGAVPGAVGASTQLGGGGGGFGTFSAGGGAGGAANLVGGFGGNVPGGVHAPGVGGPLALAGGPAGTGGSGNANGGPASLDGGPKSGTGTAGSVTIGGTNAAAVSIGRSGITTTIASNLAMASQTTYLLGVYTTAQLPSPACTDGQIVWDSTAKSIKYCVTNVWTGVESASEFNFGAYNSVNLGSATAISQTKVSNAATLESAAITVDLAGASGGANFVVKLCIDGTTCTVSNTFATCTFDCATAAGTTTACTLNHTAIPAGSTITWGVATACATDPGVNVNAHLTNP